MKQKSLTRLWPLTASIDLPEETTARNRVPQVIYKFENPDLLPIFFGYLDFGFSRREGFYSVFIKSTFRGNTLLNALKDRDGVTKK
jgi:hypothetical protein